MEQGLAAASTPLTSALEAEPAPRSVEARLSAERARTRSLGAAAKTGAEESTGVSVKDVRLGLVVA